MYSKVPSPRTATLSIQKGRHQGFGSRPRVPEFWYRNGEEPSITHLNTTFPVRRTYINIFVGRGTPRNNFPVHLFTVLCLKTSFFYYFSDWGHKKSKRKRKIFISMEPFCRKQKPPSLEGKFPIGIFPIKKKTTRVFQIKKWHVRGEGLCCMGIFPINISLVWGESLPLKRTQLGFLEQKMARPWGIY